MDTPHCRLGGDPQSILRSAEQWAGFAGTTERAAADIRHIDAGDFQGDEAILYHDRLNADLPPHLDRTSQAWAAVSAAMKVYASSLEGLQSRMTTLAATADQQQASVELADGAEADARTADAQHTSSKTAAQAALKPGETPPTDTYQNQTSGASARLAAANQTLQSTIDAANQVHSEHAAAVDRCVSAINQAAGLRFEEPPGFWGRLKNSVVGWISDHADVLQAISGVLKQIASIAGILAMIPILAPVMGPLAAATGGTAVLIDATVYAATGKGSLTDILMDAAGVIPFGKGVKLLKDAVTGEKAVKEGHVVATVVADTKDATSAGPLWNAHSASVGTKSTGSHSLSTTTGKPADGVSNAADTRTPPDRCTTAGDPINVVTGEMIMLQVDLELPGVLPLVLERVHLSSYRWGTLFGPTWASTLDQRIEVGDGGVACFVAEDGVVLYYPDAGRMGSEGSVLPSEGVRRWPLRQAAGGGWTVEDPDVGRVRSFAAPDRHGRCRMLDMSDRHGNAIYFDYDEAGVVSSVRHSGGYHVDITTANGAVTGISVRDSKTSAQLTSFGYDLFGNLTRIGNSAGEPMHFLCDDDAQIVQWTDRNNIWYRYEYDESGRCVRTSGRGRVLSYGFSYLPGRTLVTDSLGAVSEYEFNTTGQVVRTTDPLGHSTSSVWDRYDRLLLRTDALGRTTQFDYDGSGRLRGVTYPDGSCDLLERNEMGLPVRLQDAGGATWTLGYDGAGSLISETDPLGQVEIYERDRTGALVAVTDRSGAVTRVENNGAGLAVTVVEPNGALTSFEYNGFGRLSRAVDALGGVNEFGWTIAGQLAWRVGPDGAREEWAWDGEGNPTSHLDSAGARTETTSGVFDLPVARTNPDGSRMLFGYDTELRLTSVQNPSGLSWNYEYDAAGRLVAETDFNGRRLAYRHDAVGRLVGVTNAVGQETWLRYSWAGDLVERETGDGVTTFVYDAVGRMITARAPGVVVHLERDLLGRVLRETVNGRSVMSEFGPTGRRRRRQTPTGVKSEWSFDEVGRPSSLLSADQTIQFEFDAAGREIGRSFSAGGCLSQKFDVGHRMVGQTMGGDPSVATARAFNYRADGALARISDELTGASRQFDLDSSGRVVRVAAAGWSESYAYDAGGCLSDASFAGCRSDGGGGREYAGTLMKRAGNVSFGHDRHGRVIVRSRRRLSRKAETWHYTYDSDDRMVSARSGEQRWSYRYDPFGRRISKERRDANGRVAEQVLFTWDANMLVEQVALGTDGAPMVTTWDYLPGSWRPVCQVDVVADIRQFHAIVSDLVGTPTELVSPDGSRVAWSNGDSTLWGAARKLPDAPSKSVVDCPLRFPGQYADAETGLNYNRHRYYDPVAARYTTPDPLGLAPADDPYGYVPNPTGWIDPLGLKKQCDLQGGGGRAQQATGFELSGTSGQTRRLNYRPGAADPNWGLTAPHLQKHVFGTGKLSLNQIDPGGNTSVWVGYIQELASRSVSTNRASGVQDIIGTFVLTGGAGTFHLGLRIAAKGDGSYDLVTLLTRQ